MKLEDRVEDGLNELRILLLGGQVFAGFAYQSCFQARFAELPQHSQWVQAAGIALVTATFGWLLFPAAYHQIAERGMNTRRLQRSVSLVLDFGLLPLAVALGLLTYPVLVMAGLPHAWWPAATVAVGALLAWYGGLGFRHQTHEPDEEDAGALEKRIKTVLTECRVVLPGAQASLGFLFADVFTESFGRLPRSSQWMHLTALGLILVATILLMTPAAYHRLATRGEPAESVHTVASRALLSALLFLAPGMGLELFVVLRKLTDHTTGALLVAAAFVVLSYALWFGLSLAARKSADAGRHKNATVRPAHA